MTKHKITKVFDKDKIKQLRKQRRLTQKAASSELGITEKQYQNIENGHRKSIDNELLDKFATFFRVPRAILVKEIDVESTDKKQPTTQQESDKHDESDVISVIIPNDVVDGEISRYFHQSETLHVPKSESVSKMIIQSATESSETSSSETLETNNGESLSESTKHTYLESEISPEFLERFDALIPYKGMDETVDDDKCNNVRGEEFTITDNINDESKSLELDTQNVVGSTNQNDRQPNIWTYSELMQTYGDVLSWRHGELWGLAMAELLSFVQDVDKIHIDEAIELLTRLKDA